MTSFHEKMRLTHKLTEIVVKLIAVLYYSTVPLFMLFLCVLLALSLWCLSYSIVGEHPSMCISFQNFMFN